MYVSHRRDIGSARAFFTAALNRTASVVIRGHASIQNLRRGHYELAVDSAYLFRLGTAFDELKPAI